MRYPTCMCALLRHILLVAVQDIAIPDVERHVHVPVVGEFLVALRSIKVVDFAVPRQDAKLVILDSFFNLSVNKGAWRPPTKVGGRPPTNVGRQPLTKVGSGHQERWAAATLAFVLVICADPLV